MPAYASDFASLQSALTNPPIDGLIYLSNNIDAINQLSVSTSIIIDGQNFSLGLAAPLAYLFSITSAGHLTLQNITLNGNNLGTSGAATNAGNFILSIGTVLTGFTPTTAVVNNTGTFTMNDGAITENLGRGVENSGTFTLNGGSIDHNTVSGVGAGVQNGGGTFVFNNGIIAFNTASTWGGGIFSSGTFTMNGGVVDANTANYGGGIYLNPGTNQILCGKISNNIGLTYGGGIFANADGTVIGKSCSGGPYDPKDYITCEIETACDCAACHLAPSYCLLIYKNTAPRGGGIYYNLTNAQINCALIAGNSAPAEGGGGICFDRPSVSGTITFNQTALVCNQAMYGGGIFTTGGSLMAIHIENSTFIGNTATTNGGAYIMGTSSSSYVTIAPNTCFSNNKAAGVAFSTQDADNLLSCCQSLPPNLLSNYDITAYDFVQSYKFPTPDSVSYGDSLSWTVNYIAPLAATPLTFTDNLAPFTLIPNTVAATATNTAGVQSHPVVTTAGTPNNPTFTLTPPSGTAFVTLTFQVVVPQLSQTTAFDNTIYLNGTYAATGTVTVLASHSLAAEDSLTKSSSATTVAVGDSVVYTVVLTKS